MKLVIISYDKRLNRDISFFLINGYMIVTSIFKITYRPIETPPYQSGFDHLHDAVAVQQQHQNWAKEVMLETWQEHMHGVGTKVKVDLP